MQSRVFILVFIITGLLLVSCRDYTATSVVTSDGEIHRTIEVKADSNLVFTGTFPVPRDASWQTEWKQAVDDSDKVVYTARKTYTSVAEMNADLDAFDDSLAYLQIDIRLDRHFRWFNTYLTYHEIYKALNLFNALPISDFLTESQISRVAAGDTSAVLDSLMESWQEASMVEEIYQGLEKTIAANPMGGITLQELSAVKDSLGQVLQDSIDLDDKVVENILKVVEGVFPNANLEILLPDLTENLTVFRKKVDFLDKLMVDNYKLNVQMPGLIIQTNAHALEGNVAQWTVEADSMLYRDYDARVTARIINTTLLFGTLIFLGLLFSVSTGLWIYRLNKKAKPGKDSSEE
ncbi:MAG: hypothetical protein K9N34_04955 [Candidatus Marinimicrobia bacterium]|nr:hypothetical protein [Candidatus Neomarinimicrobiota bacterium]MCF7839915.1 hypothetical protein [Candidatus Neomarinimicrobiota bacterium]